MNAPIDPHAARVAARQASYPNSTVERDTIRKVDDAVFDRVRPFEQEMVRNAREWIGNADVHDQAGSALEDALREDVRRLADRSDTTVDQDLAARYRALARDAEKAIRQLEAQATHAEFTAARLESPYDEVMRSTRKYPVIRPTITF